LQSKDEETDERSAKRYGNWFKEGIKGTDTDFFYLCVGEMGVGARCVCVCVGVCRCVCVCV
jgi:hypothetical protein